MTTHPARTVPANREAYIADIRDRHQQAAQQVASGLQRLTVPAGWREWLDLAVRFPDLSLTNQLLIQAQHPQATLVQSAKHWRQVGRWPTKGSTALRIWTPRPSAPNESRRWTLSPVFDLTQTQGAELVQQPAPTPPAPGRAPRGMWEALVEYAAQHGIAVDPGQRPPGQADELTPALDLVGRLGNQPAHQEHSCEQVGELVSESLRYLVAADYGLAEAAGWNFQPLPGGAAGSAASSAQQVKEQAQSVLKAARPLLTHLREVGVGHPDPHAELLAMAPHAPHVARAR